MPKFRLHSPASIPGVGSIFEIPGEDVSVGRSPDNQVVIAESSISAHHARLRKTANGWLLVDLPQSNGLWVGIKRVSEHLLCPGQLFRIGGVALEFIDDENADASAVAPSPIFQGSDKTEQNSGIREFSSAEENDVQRHAPNALGPVHQARVSSTPDEARNTVASVRRTRALGKAFAGLLGLLVLGIASAVGGYFALRWTSRSQVHTRVLPSASVQSSAAPVPSAPVAPESLLIDREVADVSSEQQLEVPGTFKLVLPGGALHAPTHLVVARAGRPGERFCGATDFASSAFEISTLSNPVWAQAATLQLPVDVDQLAQSRVPAVAVGVFDSTKQVWSLLPTEYDSVLRVAKAQLWQPGIVALFIVNGPEVFASSEHFALLLEPGANGAKSARESMPKALAQLELALSNYRAMGYRIPNGLLWVCASRSAISRSRALLPMVHESDLRRAHSPALARAAFLNVVPAYAGTRVLDGREFWFDAMASAIASQSLGQHAAGSAPTSKRLSNSLLADDWPSPPLFVNVLNRIVDAKIDLFRLWTDTTHVMNELDTKPNAEMQSRVLAIDLALQQATQKNLLTYQASIIADRLSTAFSTSAATAEFCPTITRVHEGTSGVLKLDIPNQYSARWACIMFELPAGKYRSIHLQLASDLPPDLNVQMLRAVDGQAAEMKPLAPTAERIDMQSSRLFVVAGVNSNMAQARSISVRYDDVTPDARFENPSSATIRPGQSATCALQVSKVPIEIKSVDVVWDFGDGTPIRSTHPTNGALRLEQAHSWDRPGAFAIRATVFDHDRPEQPIALATRDFTIQSVRLELAVVDPNPQPMAEVRFTMRPSGPVPEKPQFRLNFGDGSEPSIVSSLEATHTFSKPGEYAVTAQVLSETPPYDAIATAKAALTVKSAEPPPPVASVDPENAPAPSASSPSVQ